MYGKNICTFFIIAALANTHPAFAQIRFEEHSITNSLDGAWPFCIEDLDNDDDLDIIGCGYDGYILSWFENDGDQNFRQFMIDDSTNINGCRTMDVKDFDDDGDIDAVIGIAWGDYVIFYENDGDGNFTREVINDELRATVTDIQGIDMDDDEDYDLIVSTNFGLYWFENDGDANFTEIHVISDESVWRRVVYAVDLDNDGDQDIVHGRISRNNNELYRIQWLENLGNQEFETHLVGTFFAVKIISIADCNNDDYPDILSAGCDPFNGEAEFGWWENDINQDFTYHFLAENIFIIGDLNGADLDLDGDVDILVASTRDDSMDQRDDAITWWENETNINGETIYTEQPLAQNIDFPQYVISEDMDFDGDLDVIASARFDDAILWLENYTILNRPYPFRLLSPDDEQTLGRLPCLFTWESADPPNENAEITYTFHYALDSRFLEPGDTSFVTYESDTSVVISDLNENVTYWWKVLAEDDQGGQTRSIETRSFNFDWIPTARPSGLTARLDSTGLVSLEWLEAENTGIPAFKGYAIFRNDTALDTVEEISYQDQLEERGTYTYSVAAVFRFGDTEHSNTVEINWDTENVQGTRSGSLPEKFEITAIYPNPFNEIVNITIAIPEFSEISMQIFNIHGQQMSVFYDGALSIGYHTLPVDCGGLTSGIYFMTVEMPGKVRFIRKVALLK
ncbi:FG-GAP-like repeat-containing protein [Calditrichota bacterium]